MPLRRRSYAPRIAAAYLVFAATWITLGDVLVLELTDDTRASYRLQAIKGWLFTLLSAAFVYSVAQYSRSRWFREHAALQAARSEFEVAERVAGLGHFATNPATDQRSWSPEMFRITDLDPSAGTPTTEELLALAHPEDQPGLYGAISRLRGSGEPISLTCRIRLRSGMTRWVHLRAHTAERDGLLIVGTLQDVTEVKLKELELQHARSQLVELMAHLQVAREEERLSLSMDIHDHIGAGLSGVAMSLAAMEAGLATQPEQQQRLRRVRSDLSGVVHALRAIGEELHPVALEATGLIVALESLAQDWSARTGSQLELELPPGDSVRLYANRSIHVYRVVQEALANVSKHAGGRGAALRVHVEGDTLHVIVEDRGSGIPAEPVRADAFGLRNMRQRAHTIGARLSMESRVEGGTRVHMEIPLIEDAESR